jgi:glycosyl transferase family 25
MKNYVISLKSASARREHISNEFGQKNVSFDFFDAITPSEIQTTAKELGLNISNTELTQGEIACLLSHVSLWKKAMNEQLDYIAIFEDDIFLGQDSEYFLTTSSWIPKNIEIIKLEAFAKSALMSFKSINLEHNKKIRKLTGEHLATAGYVLSLSAVNFYMEKFRNEQKLVAIDHIMFDRTIIEKTAEVYQLLPALCIQSDRVFDQPAAVITSVLETERRKRFNEKYDVEKRIKKSLFFKIKREYFRFLLNVKLLFCRISFH